jgi:RNase P subunit RPR2
MKHYVCDDCGRTLSKEARNTVTVKNVFNEAVRLHYCAGCATRRWPQMKSMFGWTRQR